MQRSSLFLFISIPAIICLTSAAVSFAKYTVQPAQRYDKKWAFYSSRTVNSAVPRLSKAENMGPLAGKHYVKSNFEYMCPGDSLLVGINSKLEIFKSDKQNKSVDRTFSFICGFFEDPNNRLVRKVNCTKPTQEIDSKENSLEAHFDNAAEKPGVSKCSAPGQFVAGLKGDRYRKLNTLAEDEQEALKKAGAPDTYVGFSKDRIFQSTCCQLNDFAGNMLKAGTCETKRFQVQKSFEHQCAQGMAIKEIKTNFHPDTNYSDRGMLITCCSVISES